MQENIENIVSEPAKIINLYFSDNGQKYLVFKVIVKSKEEKPELNFYMEASNNEEFWKIIKIPEKILKSFHVILSAPDNRLNIKITRNFRKYEVSMLAKFITYYFTEILKLRDEDVRIEIGQ